MSVAAAEGVEATTLDSFNNVCGFAVTMTDPGTVEALPCFIVAIRAKSGLEDWTAATDAGLGVLGLSETVPVNALPVLFTLLLRGSKASCGVQLLWRAGLGSGPDNFLAGSGCKGFAMAGLRALAEGWTDLKGGDATEEAGVCGALEAAAAAEPLSVVVVFCARAAAM